MTLFEIATLYCLMVMVSTLGAMIAFNAYVKAWSLGFRINVKKQLMLWVAFFQQIIALSWYQVIANDPSVIFSKTVAEWAVVIITSIPIVALGVLVTWRAYLTNPNGKPPEEEKK